MRSNAETPSAARQLRAIWEYKAWANEPLGPGWNDAFADWIKKFGFGRVADAVQMASAPRFSEDGERLPPDIRDVPRYAAVEWADDQEPGMKACYLVRGRMRLKFFYEEHDNEVLKLLRRAMQAGVSASAMHDAVDENETLEDCFAAMGIDRTEFRIAVGHPIVELRPRDLVFVRVEIRSGGFGTHICAGQRVRARRSVDVAAGIFQAAFHQLMRCRKRRSGNHCLWACSSAIATNTLS